ncbi:hypothetical protein ABZ922_28020 [Streptomyces shenzhenensis]|uniref:hypothetical protein n=1 Tax=Streptomyces shenzhenensis TaxID=943815 RepID=UPI0033C6DAE9
MRRHFDEPRVGDTVLVTVASDAEGAEPVRLTAAETHEALYGPGSDPQFAAAVWKEVLRTALSDLAPHGTGKLLVIWLHLPRLTGTVHRVCTRLRAERSDVEAEMVLALLEELAAPDAASRLSDSSLIHAARTRAWRFARDGLRELPSTQVECIAQDRALTASDGEADATTEEGVDVRVDRPDGPDGLRAPLRFRVRPEHLRKGTFADSNHGTRDRSTRYDPRKKRRSGRRVGTRPVRPAGRRA